jgi:hypothetical protein
VSLFPLMDSLCEVPRCGCSCITLLLLLKVEVGLRFEQRRFYNPHHHPEMPRTLQPLGRRVRRSEGNAEAQEIGLCFVLYPSDPGSIGDTFERKF